MNAVISNNASVGPSTPNARVATVRFRSRPELGSCVITWAPAGSAPEGNRRQRVGADVEREDLQHAERERELPS